MALSFNSWDDWRDALDAVGVHAPIDTYIELMECKVAGSSAMDAIWRDGAALYNDYAFLVAHISDLDEAIA